MGLTSSPDPTTEKFGVNLSNVSNEGLDQNYNIVTWISLPHVQSGPNPCFQALASKL